jgi:sorbitol-specific phosphotransferase system component IIBC
MEPVEIVKEHEVDGFVVGVEPTDEEVAARAEEAEKQAAKEAAELEAKAKEEADAKELEAFEKAEAKRLAKESKTAEKEVAALHQSVVDVLEFFKYDHLPTNLQAISMPFSVLANDLADKLKGPEVTVGLRKLLEAKDCFVRAAL